MYNIHAYIHATYMHTFYKFAMISHGKSWLIKTQKKT